MRVRNGKRKRRAGRQDAIQHGAGWRRCPRQRAAGAAEWRTRSAVDDAGIFLRRPSFGRLLFVELKEHIDVSLKIKI
ncbi:uncharacterized protein LOC144178910 isoform X3 [Haemaphysalis longicornis]